ncbi:MAG: energy-coupling factor transporter transmembrane protein EcfT [Methanobrevibacter sp.]|nr:energy-coupling factor transporter transmembrane protein EcfT [Methanobrevibacter sp.]
MRLTKIHPIVYIIYYLILMLFAFIFINPYYMLTFFICIFVLISLQGIKKEFISTIKGFIMMGCVIAIINPLTSRQGLTRIYLWNDFFITYESVIYGIIMALSLILVLLVFTSFNKSISYQDMLYVFSKKFPTIAMIMIMALRFIPLFSYRIEEINKLNNFENKNMTKKGFVNKVKNVANVMTIMISWAFEESMITAKSMKARGYNTSKRTSYLYYKINLNDKILLFFISITSILSIIGLFYGVGRINIYPSIDFSFNQLPLNIFYLSFLLLLLPLIYLEFKEVLIWH